MEQKPIHFAPSRDRTSIDTSVASFASKPSDWIVSSCSPFPSPHLPSALSAHLTCAGMGQGSPGGLKGQGLPGDRKHDDKKEKKFEPAAPPARVGRKQRKQKGPEAAARLPTVTPLTKCKLRLLKLERIKDYLLMEEEFVTNQERLKPQEDKNEEDRSKVDDLRGSPMSVGNLEELIDENHAIVSSSVGPEYYVGILSFVDKDQLEPGCAILMHNKVKGLIFIGFDCEGLV